MLGLLGISGKAFQEYRNVEPEIEKYMSVEIDDKTLKVPDYDLESGYCSLYTRLTAKNTFDLNFSPADAWNLTKVNNVVERVNDFKDLESLTNEGILEPGMIIGLYNSESSHNKKGREFTHVGLNLGDGKIAHFIDDSLVENYEQLKARGYNPKAIISPRK